ncbi:MAG: Hsp20/alpha crystallin family protein [Cyclobacteriaceae bacterium]
MSLVKRNGNSNWLPGLTNWFDDFMTRDMFDWSNTNYSHTGTTLPAVNIKESDDHFSVEVAAPGMSREDFKVELDNNLLTISSERKDEKVENEGERFSKREFSYQSFQRSFTLPNGLVKEDKIEAKYKDGVLQLIIPKNEEAKKRMPRTIKIG